MPLIDRHHGSTRLFRPLAAEVRLRRGSPQRQYVTLQFVTPQYVTAVGEHCCAIVK